MGCGISSLRLSQSLSITCGPQVTWDRIHLSSVSPHCCLLNAFFFCQSLIWALQIPQWSRQTQSSFHGAYVFMLETEKRINWLGNSSWFGESWRSREQCRAWVWGTGRVAYFRWMNRKSSFWRWCLSWHPTEWRRKQVPGRGSIQCKSPEAGLKMDYCCWTGSLASWLEHSREGVFKSNQHWGSDLDIFFFRFLKKAFDIASWGSLGAGARTSEAGDAFKLWNWLHKKGGDVDLSRHWDWQHPTGQILRFMNRFCTCDFSKTSCPPGEVGLFAPISPIRKPSLCETQWHNHIHMARRRRYWNEDLSVLPLCSLLFPDAQV